jgi:hypothetical protein
VSPSVEPRRYRLTPHPRLGIRSRHTLNPPRCNIRLNPTLIVHTVAGRPQPPSPGPPPIPHDEIKALVEQYLGSTRRAGQGTVSARTHRFEDVLVRTRFGVPRSLLVPGIPDLLRDTESVLSGYFSLSSSAPHLFRDRLQNFARDVRGLLASRSPEGIFWDWPGDTEVVLARKSR